MERLWRTKFLKGPLQAYGVHFSQLWRATASCGKCSAALMPQHVTNVAHLTARHTCAPSRRLDLCLARRDRSIGCRAIECKCGDKITKYQVTHNYYRMYLNMAHFRCENSSALINGRLDWSLTNQRSDLWLYEL